MSNNFTDLKHAETMVSSHLQRCCPEIVAREIAGLFLATNSRTMHTDDRRALIAYLVDQLTHPELGYPQDIIVHGLRGLARRSEWFPSLAEIVRHLDELARPRRRLLSLVRAAQTEACRETG